MRRRIGIDPLGLAGVATVVIVWQVLALLDLLPTSFPSAVAVIAALFGLITSGSFWSDTAATLISTMLGALISIVIGVPFGFMLGKFVVLRECLSPIMEFLRPINPVILVPLALLIFTGLQMKLFLIVYGGVWPILIATIYAVRSIDPVAVETARSFSLGRVNTVWRITMPMAAPGISTGVRISITIALLVSIVAELIAGASGIGQELLAAQISGAYATLYALVVSVGIIGLLLNSGLVRAEKIILFWTPANRVNA